MNRTRRPRATAARAAAMALALTSLAAPHAASAKKYEGSVLAPVPHPAIARTAHSVGMPNGLVGYVVDLSPAVNAGSSYVIQNDSGSSLSRHEVYWYPDLDADTSPCAPTRETDAGPNRRQGTVLCKAEVAIVVLLTGVAADFSLIV